MLLIEKFLNDLDESKIKVFTEEGEEAPPPDAGGPADMDSGPPPDIGGDDMGADAPPDMGDAGGGDDMDMGGGDDFGSSDDMGMDDGSSDDGSGEGQKKEQSFGEKISNILNGKLYQRFLALLPRSPSTSRSRSEAPPWPRSATP